MKRTGFRLSAGVVIAGLVMLWITSAARAIPPDPDNAALLYYQAFLTVADLDKEARDHIGDVARGTAPVDEKVREDIRKCRGAIDFAEAARDLRVCHWGFRYSQGFDALMPQLAQMRFLAYVLLADARIRAADGDLRSALDRCLMMGPFSRHVGDDTVISYLVSVAVRRVGYECMGALIGRAADDAELLKWLQAELATSEGEQPFPVTALKTEREIALAGLTMDNIEQLARALGDSNEKQAQILRAANEELLARTRRRYSEQMSSLLTVLSSDMPYDQAHQRLVQLGKNLDPNDPVNAAATALIPAFMRVLTVKTMLQGQANATRAAVEICLQRVRTGKLPDKLPAGLPGDPLSGRDFRYERTDAGFVLRCQGKDLDKDTVPEFTFAVR